MRQLGLAGLCLSILCQACASNGPHGAPDAATETGEDADVPGPTPRDGAPARLDAPPGHDAATGTDGPPAGPDAPPAPDAAAAPDVAPAPPLGACNDLIGPPVAPPLFVPPAAGFVLAPSEMATRIALESRPLAEVQAAIDAARAKDATSLVRVELTGSFEVTTAPLRLPSRSVLVLGGALRAGAAATAPSLISVDNAELVGISGGNLDGAGKVAVGIAVTASAHVHIDGVHIAGATEDALRFGGRGAATSDTGSSITRVEASGARNGIVVGDAANVVLIDNYSHDNKGAGLALGGGFSVVANNRLRKNATGLASNGTSNLVYRNALDCNAVALAAGDAGNDTIIVQNRFGGNGKDLTLGGTANVLFGNLLPVGIQDGGQGNFVLNNAGKLSPAVTKSANLVFLPPTSDQRHKDAVTPGKPRVDLAFTPQSAPDLPAAVTKARADHPGATLVLDLKGDFSLAGPLVLSSDSVLLLDGTLKLAGTGPIIQGDNLTAVEISGGTLDCGGQRVSGTMFNNGTGVVLDGVKVVNCKADAVHFSHGRPNVVFRSDVQGSDRRCLWAQTLSRLLVVDSAFSGCTMDGIDMDSHDSFTYSLGNHTFNNKRYGIFFEEGGKRNVAVNNLTEGNGKGVNVYSNASPGTDFNLVVANRVVANGNQGLRAGALPGMDTSSNYFFNNLVSKNGSGIYQDGAVKLNYFSQNVLVDNKADIVDSAANLVFFNPPLLP